MHARQSSLSLRLGRAMTARGPLGIALMALAVGIGGAVASVLFVWMIDSVTHLSDWATSRLGWVGLIGSAALGGLIVGLMVFFFAKEAKGHGVPNVMAAIALKGGRIRPRVVAVKGIASAITIATGGSAGREGPIVQVGSALGSAIGQWFKVSESNMKTLVACGAAAGIAATFNAPIGGVFFAMEVILGDWDGARFGLITISSVAAAALAHGMMGDHPALAELSYTLKSGWELGFYALLGVVIMLGAQLYSKVLYGFEDYFDESKRVPEWVKPAIGGILFAVLGLAVPATLGRGEDIVHSLLSGRLPEQVSSWSMLGPAVILLLLGLGKILSTSITIGSGGSGGIFFPGLFIGAAFGGSFGHVAHSLAPNITASPGAYALVGMGAFFAGMTHAPITAIVMLFEMTRDYRIILPLMLTCAIAAALSKWMHPESIYTLKLVRDGIHLRRGREVGALRSLAAREVMSTKIDAVHELDTIGDVIAFMQKTHHTGFPVLDAEDRLVGMISLSDIRRTPLEGRLTKRVSQVMTRPVVAVGPETNVEEVLQIMSRRDIGRVPVIDPHGDDDRLLGLITRSNILNAYNARLLEREAGE